jgi:hypothetical protein
MIVLGLKVSDKVSVVDVPGTFLSVDMEEEVIISGGHLVELMVKTAPHMYRK